MNVRGTNKTIYGQVQFMGKIGLRDVCVDDREFLFGLANDQECRKNPLDAAYIPLEEHDLWRSLKKRGFAEDIVKIQALLQEMETIILSITRISQVQRDTTWIVQIQIWST